MKTNRAMLITAFLLSAACLATACLPTAKPAAAPLTKAPILGFKDTASPKTTAATASASESIATPAETATPAKSAAPDDTLESAVSAAVLSRLSGWDYPFGEKRTEGHVILSTAQDKDSTTIVYAIASYCIYGFENGVFTITSGSWSIPAVIRFSKSTAGYTLQSYTEPEDGEGNMASAKNLFPSDLWPSVLNTEQFETQIQSQMEAQAKEYLKSIGRDAQIHTDYVDRELFRISADASNALIEIPKLNDYPYWIGSHESIENGVRCIYEANEEDFDGYTVLTFTKKTGDGNIVEQLKYKVTGGSVEPVQ